MLLDEKLEQVNSEKKLLEIQVKDLDDLITVREEELDLLREKARQAVKIKSELDIAVNDILYLQQSIEDDENARLYPDLIKNLEEDLAKTLQKNHEHQNQLKEQAILATQLKLTEEELDTAMDYYSKYRKANLKITSLTCDLELAVIELDDVKKKLEALTLLFDEAMKLNSSAG